MKKPYVSRWSCSQISQASDHVLHGGRAVTAFASGYVHGACVPHGEGLHPAGPTDNEAALHDLRGTIHEPFRFP